MEGKVKSDADKTTETSDDPSEVKHKDPLLEIFNIYYSTSNEYNFRYFNNVYFIFAITYSNLLLSYYSLVFN